MGRKPEGDTKNIGGGRKKKRKDDVKS